MLFYGLRGLCVGRVDQFDRFRCEAPGRIRFDFWYILERIAISGADSINLIFRGLKYHFSLKNV